LNPPTHSETQMNPLEHWH